MNIIIGKPKPKRGYVGYMYIFIRYIADVEFQSANKIMGINSYAFEVFAKRNNGQTITIILN